MTVTEEEAEDWFAAFEIVAGPTHDPYLEIAAGGPASLS
jgi:hypothetical protein